MRESFVFYRSYYEAINELPEEYKLEVLNAIMEYNFNGTLPELSPVAKAMFTLMKPNMDNAARRYNASVENGKKGGRPPKENLEKPNNNLEKPKQNLNDNVYVNDNDNIEKENIKEKETTEQSSVVIARGQKHKYGEYKHVLLTEDEHRKLVEKYSDADELIKYLDEYIEMKGYKAKSHYLCLLKWVRNAVDEKKPKQKYSSNNVYEYEQFYANG